MRHTHRALAATAIVSIVFTAACDGVTDPDALTAGTVRVTAATTGVEPDTDGYVLSVGGATYHLPPNGSVTARIGGPDGTYDVGLEGTEINCTVGGGANRLVVVTVGEIATVDFAITCTHRLGNIAVSVTSSGADLPTDGYRVAVDHDAGQAIGTNDALTIADVRAVSHAVELINLASNCAVALPNPQTVLVEFGETALVSFSVTCVPVSQLPGGRQLAFVRDGYITVSNGGHEVPLALGVHPAWSPDGQRIAFVRQDESSRNDIYVMDANGSNIVRRTIGVGVRDHTGGFPISGFHSPAWSPDGSKLAIASGHHYEGDIYLLSAADDGELPVPIAVMAAAPAWSPDGSKIAFVSLSGDDGYQALHMMNADGSDVREVTRRDEGGIEGLTWSPDGERIAFSKCHGDCDVHIVSEDGSDSTQLTHVGTAFNPAWSPDGAWIAFTLWNGWALTRTAAIAFVAPDTAGNSITIMGAGTSPAWRP